VRIVCVLLSPRGLALSQFERNKVNVAPNYNLLHWRPSHVNGVVFAELDSYDIHGMSAMIYRSVSHHRIPYILGATGEGRRRLRRSPMRDLDSMDYVFINSDETSVRYGASGAPKNAGPWPNFPPRPAERPGAGRVFLGFAAPAPGPARSPDGSPLKQVVRNRAPSRE